MAPTSVVWDFILGALTTPRAGCRAAGRASRRSQRSGPYFASSTRTKVPVVFLFNKRDLPDIVPIAELEMALGVNGAPSFDGNATEGGLWAGEGRVEGGDLPPSGQAVLVIDGWIHEPVAMHSHQAASKRQLDDGEREIDIEAAMRRVH